MRRRCQKSRMAAWALTVAILFGGALTPAMAQAPDPDLNNDGVVNILELSLVGSCFGVDPTTVPRCAVADTDGDGDIDIDDYIFVLTSFGQTGFPTGEPEDSTPPTVTPPADLIVAAVDASGTPASDLAIQAFLGGASAQDTTDGVLLPTNNAPPLFPLGPTLVTFSATDDAGNTGTASATVRVEDQTPPVVTAPPDVTVDIDKSAGAPSSTPEIFCVPHRRHGSRYGRWYRAPRQQRASELSLGINSCHVHRDGPCGKHGDGDGEGNRARPHPAGGHDHGTSRFEPL